MTYLVLRLEHKASFQPKFKIVYFKQAKAT